MNVAIEQVDNINLDHWHLPDLDMQRQSWDVPSREAWRVENRFRQTSARSRTSMLFKLFNGHFLAIESHRRKRALPEQVIDLTFVEPRPREVKNQHYALWFAAVCLLTIPAVTYSLVPVSPVWFLVPVIAALVLMVAAACLKTHHYDFMALNSDVALFRVEALSDPEKVADFVKALRAGITAGQSQLPEGKQRVPLAVAEMRRLAKAGIITNDQYESIKRNWFAI